MYSLRPGSLGLGLRLLHMTSTIIEVCTVETSVSRAKGKAIVHDSEACCHCELACT